VAKCVARVKIGRVAGRTCTRASSFAAQRYSGYRRSHCPPRGVVLAYFGQSGRSGASIPPTVLLGDTEQQFK